MCWRRFLGNAFGSTDRAASSLSESGLRANQPPAAEEDQEKSDRLEDVVQRVVIEVDRVDANPKSAESRTTRRSRRGLPRPAAGSAPFAPIRQPERDEQKENGREDCPQWQPRTPGLRKSTIDAVNTNWTPAATSTHRTDPSREEEPGPDRPGRRRCHSDGEQGRRPKDRVSQRSARRGRSRGPCRRKETRCSSMRRRARTRVAALPGGVPRWRSNDKERRLPVPRHSRVRRHRLGRLSRSSCCAEPWNRPSTNRYAASTQ